MNKEEKISHAHDTNGHERVAFLLILFRVLSWFVLIYETAPRKRRAVSCSSGVLIS